MDPSIFATLREIFATRSQEQWCQLAAQHDFCCEPIIGLSQLEDDEHVKARNLLLEKDGWKTPKTPMHFMGAADPVPHFPSPLGADGGTILQEAGFLEDEIAALLSSGVTAGFQPH